MRLTAASNRIFEKLSAAKPSAAKAPAAKPSAGRLSLATLTVLLALSLAACGGEDKGGTAPSAAATPNAATAPSVAAATATPAAAVSATTTAATTTAGTNAAPTNAAATPTTASSAEPHTPDMHTTDPEAAHATDPHAAHGTDPHAAHATDPHTTDPHAAHAAPLAATELPGTSLFHLSGTFKGQDGAEFRLGELRGRPTVIVMFYGDCTTACPLLVKSAQDIEAALPPEVAEQTQFVMVSFDTARDTPAKLRAYAQERGLDKGRWHWLVGSPLLTRQLATLLGVQYRDAGNGMFAHSNLVTVLDEQGVPEARIEGLGAALDPAVDAIRAFTN